MLAPMIVPMAFIKKNTIRLLRCTNNITFPLVIVGAISTIHGLVGEHTELNLRVLVSTSTNRGSAKFTTRSSI